MVYSPQAELNQPDQINCLVSLNNADLQIYPILSSPP